MSITIMSYNLHSVIITLFSFESCSYFKILALFINEIKINAILVIWLLWEFRQLYCDVKLSLAHCDKLTIML